jgi:hypothetical protein
MNDERMHSTNVLNFVDAELRAKMLGDAIPAESFAAGANYTGGIRDNYNMHDYIKPNWPRKENSKNIWLLSDIKNVAYYFLYPLFNNFIEEEIKQ